MAGLDGGKGGAEGLSWKSVTPDLHVPIWRNEAQPVGMLDGRNDLKRR